VIESYTSALDEPWAGRFKRREISDADLNFAVRHYNNVITEFTVVLKAIKPPGNQAAKLTK
jgi:hypothetical protein